MSVALSFSKSEKPWGNGFDFFDWSGWLACLLWRLLVNAIIAGLLSWWFAEEDWGAGIEPWQYIVFWSLFGGVFVWLFLSNLKDKESRKRTWTGWIGLVLVFLILAGLIAGIIALASSILTALTIPTTGGMMLVLGAGGANR
jgi:peptidoglycan/LPS O-acetylase OafA/YrhL